VFESRAWRKQPLRTAWRLAAYRLKKSLPLRKPSAQPYDGGRSRILVDPKTHLGYVLALYGQWDPDVALVGRLLSAGDLFLDGGAHVGLFTLVAASRVGPTGGVLAFEPAEPTRRLLAGNVALNRFEWVEVRAEALGDEEGAREFVEFTGAAWGHSSFAPPSGLDAGNRTRVAVTTLDRVTAALDRARVRLVKLDVEGAEGAALRGARELLAAARPDLLIEVEPEHLERQGTSAAELERLLEPYGYALYQAAWNDADGVTLSPTTMAARDPARPNVLATTDPARLRRAGIEVLDSPA
jgi:FkbM family methyltransferase